MHFPEGSEVLFVGEGDFSFVTALTQEDGCAGVHLTVTAFQDQLSERARQNVELLREQGIKVSLGVDATRLHLHPLTQHLKYTHIVFNFPHVGGKMRIERNRKLLREFFDSATRVLAVGGWVMVTLCGGQGGVTLDPMARRYDDSWKVVLMASYANMVLRSIQKFAVEKYPGYSATGYRSMEKGFCQDAALTFNFQVSALPSPEPADALSTQDVMTCSGSSLQLPSFFHTQIQRDIVVDSSCLVGHFYSLLLGMLRGRLVVQCCDKLVFRKEDQEQSLRNYCEKVVFRKAQESSLRNSKAAGACESDREFTVFTQMSHRVNTDREGKDSRDSGTTDCSEKLAFTKEAQNKSPEKSMSVSKCPSLPSPQPTVFCHSSYRISTKGRLRLEPLIILLCPGNIDVIESTLSQMQTMNIRNISKSFVPEVKTFAFGDFTEDSICCSDDENPQNAVTCYLINVTSLVRECGGVDEDEMWGRGQAVRVCDDVLTYSSFSLFPREYTYDLSFWESKICDEGVAAVSNALSYQNNDDRTVSSNGKSSKDSAVTQDMSELTVSSNDTSSLDAPLTQHRSDIKAHSGDKSLGNINKGKLTASPSNTSSDNIASTSHTCQLMQRSDMKALPGDKSSSDSQAITETSRLTASSSSRSPVDISLTASLSNTNSDIPPINQTNQMTVFPLFQTSLSTIIINTGGETLRSYKLLSVYDHPKLGRRSYTYRLVYRNWHGALSDEAAKRIHSQIGWQLEECLGVEVRW